MYSPASRLLAAAIISLCACAENEEQSPPLFELLSPKATGVTFTNHLPEDADFNILNYLYYYNGGGVAAGDIDGDGLPDLYFTSNLDSDRLYLNKGDYKFEDITESAGVTGPPGWTSGVTMADVNGDGRLDIYVSAVNYLAMNGRNMLYINNGDRTFTDRAAEYGLEHAGYSTQAAFFDYDRDGDLDMYLLNHSTHTERGIRVRPQREVRHPKAGDRLFRNDGNRFVDVSAAAGIFGSVEGYGLGVVASDLNVDGCPDLFVANDFQENDFLYINNCDGTFTESIARAMGHTSRFSMGVDAADFNNDGLPDLMVLDMLPESEEVLKTSVNAETFNVHNLKIRAGYWPQYARNTLQLNRGNGRFSDIGYLAGVSATDWSWAALFADLDNDGDKDLFVTNGIYRRPNDLDYINYISNDAVQKSLGADITEENLSLLHRMPQIPLVKYGYRNNGDLTFSAVTRDWGLATPGFSNGAAYVDLNNSGSLDLVVNNVNAPASIYRNTARTANGNHSLTVKLRGSGRNTAGIGARVLIRHGGRLQMVEQMPTRGFQSSVDPRVHFGLGSSASIDSVIVIWPDQRFQVLTEVAADRVLTLTQDSAAGRYDHRAAGAESVKPVFADVSATFGVDFRHEENDFLDYNREPWMPHLLSTEGPALAAGDVNGDGLDDIYIGGAKWQAGRLLVQTASGQFRPAAESVFRADSVAEDVDAVFFDANGDGAQDLYVVSGGNEFWAPAEALRDRLYINDGKGNFQRSRDALPEFFENGGCVAAGDFDTDGDLDLFVGSRVVSRSYGATPKSHLLENDGSGRFTDVTGRRSDVLGDAGMVSSAAWVDYDGDRQLDLIVAGEWMPVRVFRQQNGRFLDRTKESGLANTEGWWNMVVAADLNRDGKQDLVLGNLGLNSYIRAARNQPARLYVGDFFGNGAVEQILTFYKQGVSYPLAGRDEFVRLMPQLRSKYPSYASFGASRVEDILPAAELGKANVLEAREFASSVAMNNGNGTFTMRALPAEAQFAPIYAALAGDYDADGNIDLVVAGNFHGVTPVRGRYDASYGLLLRGTGDGRFEAVETQKSNLVIEGQVRSMAPLRSATGGRLIVVARNDDKIVFLRPLLTNRNP